MHESERFDLCELGVPRVLPRTPSQGQPQSPQEREWTQPHEKNGRMKLMMLWFSRS
jgi:hypothetical protein